MKILLKRQPKSRVMLARGTLLIAALYVLVSCSSGGSSTPDNDPLASDADIISPTGGDSLEEINSTADGLTDTGTPGVSVDITNPATPTDIPIDNGDLLPLLADTDTDLDLQYAELGVALTEELSESLLLPNDIDVFFVDCGIANAFYLPPFTDATGIGDVDALPRSEGGSIIMCHELTLLFSDFYGDKDQAVSASLFVLMHEVGHALVNQLNLPVLGIEESYVDGMSAVFLGEAGEAVGSVLAGWFFGAQPEVPFFDTHRAGPQRLGDLACWGVGADPSLQEDPTVNSISQQLIIGGRNCIAEYNQQLDALNIVLGPYLRGTLSEIFAGTDTTL